MSDFLVLLFYKFIELADPAEFATSHLAYCKAADIRGRVIVASEGINGTISAPRAVAEEYMRSLRQDARFADMPFKIDTAKDHVFEKLFVRAKPEIVTFRADREIDVPSQTGKRLSPLEFRAALDDERVLVLDGRSDYEYDLGHFRGALRPDVRTFREFPNWIRENLAAFKDRPIVTYCTGGIRCEKLTSFLLQEGFRDVAQLDGGIVTYGNDPEVEGEMFDGRCYVFDERISVPINKREQRIVSTCRHCGAFCDRYINCSVLSCHRQHFSCKRCEAQMLAACSAECRKSIEREVEVQREVEV